MSELSSKEQNRLFDQFGRRYSQGEHIFRESEPAAEVFMLQEGKVRILKKVRTTERSLQILKPGDIFGEGALIQGSLRTSSAVALNDVNALALDPETFSALMQGNSEVAMRLVQQLIRRMRDAEDQIENMLLRDNQSKIVNALLKLAGEAGWNTGTVQVQISPLELSSRSGLDVDTVKRGVQQLRENQYIRIAEERVVIDDLDALRRLFGLLGNKEQIRS